MALRLAGTPFLAIQGTDNQGWVREVTSLDALPGLKVDQQGTGRIVDFQDGGVSRLLMLDGGHMTLADAASPPNPDSLLHIWAGDAGAVAAVADTVLTVENSTHAYISFLTPNTATVGLRFGDPQSNTFGAVLYDHTNGRLITKIEGGNRLFYSAGAFAFQEPTAIKTTTGDLTLDPAGEINLNGKNLRTANSNILMGTGRFLLDERADPAAPSANQATLYARDNGSGKTQLVVRFPTGAIQAIATEP